MSDVLEKLGIFDLLAVLLTGVSVMTVSLLVFEAMCLDSVNIELDIEKALPFFVLSYLCGIALQEIGSLIEKKRFEGGIWTVFEKDILDTNSSEKAYLRYTYLRDTYQYLRETLGAENSTEGADTHNNIVYDYCKRHAQKKQAMSQIDRFTCVCVMSRSLSLYFCLLAGVLLLLAILDFSCLEALLFAISASPCVLFYHRFEKSLKIRYLCLLAGVLLFFAILHFSCLEALLFAISASLCVLFYHRFKRFSEIRYRSVFQIFYYDNRRAIKKWKQTNLLLRQS